ncbi:DoxX family protein [Mucilaginibacter terrae]|uniref:DoxX family protein n=1 Tax=Mucilaginibacter terrae TaxID=1955052 RepID=UPI0036411DAE
MKIIASIDNLHTQVKANRWIGYFTIFCRIALAAGFLPSGYVKIIGERFTDLHNNQPMGHYLEALHHTGYYYTFIGILQITAAVLLLIPPTALLGALLYFPIILNICILSLAVRFEGSLLTAPLMVIANLYLLCLDYDKLKFIFPFNKPVLASVEVSPKVISNKFPTLFFAGVFATVVLWGVIITHVYDIMPRNTIKGCKTQCDDNANPNACNTFCESIHLKGETLDKSLDAYHEALKKTKH